MNRAHEHGRRRRTDSRAGTSRRADRGSAPGSAAAERSDRPRRRRRGGSVASRDQMNPARPVRIERGFTSTGQDRTLRRIDRVRSCRAPGWRGRRTSRVRAGRPPASAPCPWCRPPPPRRDCQRDVAFEARAQAVERRRRSIAERQDHVDAMVPNEGQEALEARIGRLRAAGGAHGAAQPPARRAAPMAPSATASRTVGPVGPQRADDRQRGRQAGVDQQHLVGGGACRHGMAPQSHAMACWAGRVKARDGAPAYGPAPAGPAARPAAAAC